jgi:hypothetical protein
MSCDTVRIIVDGIECLAFFAAVCFIFWRICD